LIRTLGEGILVDTVLGYKNFDENFGEGILVDTVLGYKNLDKNFGGRDLG